MTHDWKGVSTTNKDRTKRDLSSGIQYRTAIAEGAQVYHCTNAPELDLGALRIILGGNPVAPKVQQEPINKGTKWEQVAVTAELAEEMPELAPRHNSNMKKLEESMQKAMDEKLEELWWELKEQCDRRAREEADGLRKSIAEMQSKEKSIQQGMIRKHRQELEEQKRRVREQADMFKKQIAGMQSKEESIRKEFRRELEEQDRRAREEADGLRKRIAKMQSELEEDRHRSGKAFELSAPSFPPHLKAFLVGPCAHLAPQHVYPSTDLHPNSPVVSTTHFMARSMNNACETFRRMTLSGSLTIWTRYATMSPSPTSRSRWLVDSQTRSFGSCFSKVLTRTQKDMRGS